MGKIGADNYVVKTYLFSFILIFTISVKEVTQFKFTKNSENARACLDFTSRIDSKLQQLDLSVGSDSVYSKNPGVEALVAELRQFVLENRINYCNKTYIIKDNFFAKFDSNLGAKTSFRNYISALLRKINGHRSPIQVSTAGVSYKLKEIHKNLLAHLITVNRLNQILGYLFLILLVVELYFIVKFFRKNMFAKLDMSIRFTEMLAKGSYGTQDLPVTKGQFGQLMICLNHVNAAFRNASVYFNSLIKGNFQIDDEAKRGENEFVDSIRMLASQLQSAKQKELQDNWMNLGLAKFGELLQQRNDDRHALGDTLISELVKYIGANQGAIFTMEDEEYDKHLELLSTYAWDKKRFVDGKVALESGNLMVQAIKSKKYLYLHSVPQNYIKITSGLGESNPDVLLIVPLMCNDECLGVVELAAFKKFDDHVIEFTTKVSESIAATFSTMESTENTKRLLESSQAMTEMLRTQEEELRQNAEELEASRENLNRELELAKLEMQHQVEDIENEKLKNIAILEGCVDGVIIFKEDGIVEFFNKSAEEIWGISREVILGKSINNLFPVDINQTKEGSSLYYKGERQFKQIDVRTEINTYDPLGNEMSLLVTSSQGSVAGIMTYAFFVQTITVELF